MRRALGVIVVLTASTLTTFPAAATPPTKPSASAPSSVAPRPRPGPPVPGVRQPKPVVTPDCATLKAQRKALAVPVAKAPAAKAPRARRPDGLEPEPPGVAIPAWCNDGLAGGVGPVGSDLDVRLGVAGPLPRLLLRTRVGGPLLGS